jgi:uncharacterized NAD-dependent epimerase/dehydratase family protein
VSEPERRIAILAEGTLEYHHGKTAISVLRYRPESVVAVIDSRRSGRTVGDVLGIGGSIPICRDVQDSLKFRPTELLIGIAPRGGELPPEWRGELLRAIEAGLDIVSGLHYMLRDDPELREAAVRRGTRLIDVRRAPEGLSVARLEPRRPGSRVITFVGSDCAVGKMTAALEMVAAARRMGLSAAFVATGQTGIMLSGAGIAVDRVIGDFMAGAIEDLVLAAAEGADWVFVEGQGSLLHPGYSGVTLALLHGSTPDALILVHPPSRQEISGYSLAIPPLDRLVAIYEEAASWIRPAPVVGIALNTRDLDADETRAAIEAAESLTGLPAVDPVKCGGERLVAAVFQALTGSALTVGH